MSSSELISKALQYVIQYGSPSDIIGIAVSTAGSAITALIGFGVKFLRDLSKSVEKLNTNIEVLVVKTNGHENSLEDHENRIRSIEHKRGITKRLKRRKDDNHE